MLPPVVLMRFSKTPTGAAMAEAAKRRVIIVMNCILVDLVLFYSSKERCVCNCSSRRSYRRVMN